MGPAVGKALRPGARVGGWGVGRPGKGQALEGLCSGWDSGPAPPLPGCVGLGSSC